MKKFNELKKFFLEANLNFFKNNKNLIDAKISERTLCGALMLELYKLIISNPEFKGYYVDIEYNRLKVTGDYFIKHMKNRRISCDLIIHGRGQLDKEDCLLVLEMKKSNSSQNSKNQDKERLMFLTSQNNDNFYNYVIGIYFEINFKKKKVELLFYNKGVLVDTKDLDFRKYVK